VLKQDLRLAELAPIGPDDALPCDRRSMRRSGRYRRYLTLMRAIEGDISAVNEKSAGSGATPSGKTIVTATTSLDPCPVFGPAREFQSIG